MFTKTKQALLDMINEIKLVCKVIKYTLIGISLVYFIIAIALRTGNLFANILSCSLFIVYTIFELSTSKLENKGIRKKVRKIYVWLRIAIRAFALTSIIYGIYTSQTDVNPLSTIMLTFMIILWILQVLFEVTISIISKYVNSIVSEIKNDFNDMKESVNRIPLIQAAKKIKNKFSRKDEDYD